MRKDDLAAHNERVKLRANTVNAIALAFIAFGFLRPLVERPTQLPWIAIAWAIAGLAIHLLASYILQGLRQRRDQE
ncbi:MAG: hypothetical protein ACPGNV_08760 [Mangrovicoccus sp.]